ncbi:hypothetical protein JCM15764A_33170 [Geotalea toluenoxydans]
MDGCRTTTLSSAGVIDAAELCVITAESVRATKTGKPLLHAEYKGLAAIGAGAEAIRKRVDMFCKGGVC